MSPQAQAIDYDALAKQSGAVGATPQPPAQPGASPNPGVDVDALARQSGAVAATSSPDTPDEDTRWYGPDGLLRTITDAPYRANVGAAKELASDAAGIVGLINNPHQLVPGDDGSHAIIPVIKKATDWVQNKTKPQGAAETTGKYIADIGEFWATDGLLKGATAYQKVKALAPIYASLEKLPPKLLQTLAMAIRTGTVATGQNVAHGDDIVTALKGGALTAGLGVAGNEMFGRLGKYLAKLKALSGEAADAAAPITKPSLIPPEPRPVRPAMPEAPPAGTRPTPPEPPPARVPAAERFAAHEQGAAQAVTGEHLEDLNKYRAVDERGTPTNIQQLGLPSQSVTEPYEFRVPGWSHTTEAGDLLHEAGARYKQEGTRVVEGKGDPNMKPWEMQQATPFDLPKYGEQPGSVVRDVRPDGSTVPLTPPGEAPPPPPESSPVWAQDKPDSPTTAPSHKEPIMRATAYKTESRPGSEARTTVTQGGPSILTRDPEIAARHLDNIEAIVSDPNFKELPPEHQADILHSRNDVMQQMNEYKQLQPQHQYSPYLHQPTFEPMDIDAALSRVGNAGDAAKEMMRGPKEMYNRWNDLTENRPGGSFKNLNNELQELQGKTGPANRQRYAEVQDELHKMFNGSDPYLGRAGTNIDRAIASAQFKDGYLVKRIDDAFTDAYKGAARTGDFDVGRLQSNWKALVNEVGPERVRNVWGPERYEATNNIINDLAGEPAADKAATAELKAKHDAAMDDFKQLEKEKAATQRAAVGKTSQQYQATMDEFKQRQQDRVEANRKAMADYREKVAAQKAAAATKQKWYYDLAKNGWYHMASGAGMEGVANLMPKGVIKMLSAKAGAALVLKAIITHPMAAKVAYQGARVLAKPALYGPVIADILRSQGEDRQSTTMAAPNPKGLVEAGNIDITNRPVVQNDDGSHSTELSLSMEDDKGNEVLVPTIAGGKFLTPDGKMPPGPVPKDWSKASPEWKALRAAAWKRYEDTGEHLGKFSNPDDAESYAETLHNRGEK